MGGARAGGGSWLLLLWLVPLVTTQVWIGAVAELMEHFPLIETAPRVDIHMTWNRVYGLATRFLLGEKDGEGFHLVHHLFPRTPMWRLREVDAILRRDPVYAALPRLGGVSAGWARSPIAAGLTRPARPARPDGDGGVVEQRPAAVEEPDDGRHRADDAGLPVEPGPLPLPDRRHLRPVHPRAEVVLLVVAVVERQEVVDAVVVAHRVRRPVVRVGPVVAVVVLHVDQRQGDGEKAGRSSRPSTARTAP